jgi:hypothetical protein
VAHAVRSVPGSLDKNGEDSAIFYETKMEPRWNLSSSFFIVRTRHCLEKCVSFYSTVVYYSVICIVAHLVAC